MRRGLIRFLGLGVACVAIATAAWYFLTSEVPPPSGWATLEIARGRGAVTGKAFAHGTTLRVGDEIRTGPDGQALIQLGPHVRLLLAPHTRLKLARMVQRRLGGHGRVRVEMAEGRAGCTVADGTEVLMSTPVGRATLGRGAVEVAREGDAMRVAAWKGEAAYVSEFMNTVQYALSEGEELVADRAHGVHQVRHLESARRDDGWVKGLLEATPR